MISEMDSGINHNIINSLKEPFKQADLSLEKMVFIVSVLTKNRVKKVIQDCRLIASDSAGPSLPILSCKIAIATIDAIIVMKFITRVVFDISSFVLSIFSFFC